MAGFNKEPDNVGQRGDLCREASGSRAHTDRLQRFGQIAGKKTLGNIHIFPLADALISRRGSWDLPHQIRPGGFSNPLACFWQGLVTGSSK